jgi:methylmalonyl-CoA mutase
MLWFQVAHAYGHSDYKLGDLHLHVNGGKSIPHAFLPQEMVSHTFRAMAAVLGGCDSLTISSATDALTCRLTRNISHILREESFFDKVSDPLAGAYALDAMIDAMAGKAWESFQLKMEKS